MHNISIPDYYVTQSAEANVNIICSYFIEVLIFRASHLYVDRKL